jgi:hypothetical protein
MLKQLMQIEALGFKELTINIKVFSIHKTVPAA